MKRTAVILAAVISVACSKEKPADSDAGSGAPSASAPASASASASASAAPARTSATYEGKYTAAPATYYIPTESKDWSGVKQAKEDGTKMIGEGTLSLTVDPTGNVSGTIDSGPASPGIIAGLTVDGALNGTVRPKETGTDGLTGTFVGKVTGDSVEGTMKLANENALLLREAKFSAKKK